MASITMIEEEDATGQVLEIYEDIKNKLGIDFVPNMYKAMALRPAFLEAQWHKINAVMTTPGKLDPLTREIVAVAVASVMGCNY